MKDILARVDRDELTGEVSLRLIKDTDQVEITEGAEYVTIDMKVNPWKKPDE